MKASLIAIAFLLVATAIGAGQPLPRMPIPIPPLPPPDEDSESRSFSTNLASNITGSAYFEQFLDHDDASKGTFKMRYWWNAEKWAGPGSPVVLFTPGEVAADGYTGYLRNGTLPGHFAQEVQGATILIEHRYYGSSSPYDPLTVEALQYLTIEQAIQDMIHFAKTVYLPFDPSNSSNADMAPWVFSGGSYSGALAAYTASVSPGTFWAYHASSAPVEAIWDFWQYFAPIQAGMPKNCSKDVSLVIEYVDDILKKGTPAEQKELKSMFGLEAVEHAGDFGNALQLGPWNWQNMGPYTEYSPFYQFCDAVENVTAGAAITPDENGVGLETALAGYANWVRPEYDGRYACTYYGYDEYDFTCYESSNPDAWYYKDIGVDNAAQRQWTWILCNEPLGFWQTGAPPFRPTIISRFVSASYWQSQCELYFPTETNANGTFTYRSKLSADENVHKVNKWTKGWRLDDTTRLMWANGEYDPWIPGSVSSEFRPGGPLESTVDVPVNVIPGGIHCYDLIIRNGVVDEGVRKVIDAETRQIVEWVNDYYEK